MRRLGWVLRCVRCWPAARPQGRGRGRRTRAPVDAGPTALTEKEPNERPEQALTLTATAW